MKIVDAIINDIPAIHTLAQKIWWPTYRPILAEEQISFMLEKMYSETALKEQMQGDIKFILVKSNNDDVAFAGYAIENSSVPLLKIHKIYILPSEQGKGTGKMLVEYLVNIAKNLQIAHVELNVNRANPALWFYEKMGFQIIESVDIPYHQFVLNDYIMRKEVF